MRITLSSFLNLLSSLSTTFPEKSIPGTKGNFLTIFPPLFNNDESIPMFYRNNILNNEYSINIGELIINITKIESSESSSEGYDI